MARRAVRYAGVTMAEMLVVVAILAVMARVAIPNAAPLATIGSDAVTSEITRAIRFAQREAIRTSAWYTVKIDTTTQTLRVYRLTAAGIEDTSLPVLQPIDKNKYDLAFGSGPARATITLVDFDYDKANVNQNTLSFGPDGEPCLITGSKKPDIKALTAGVVTIRYGAGQRTLAIDVLTGRVSG